MPPGATRAAGAWPPRFAQTLDYRAGPQALAAAAPWASPSPSQPSQARAEAALPEPAPQRRATHPQAQLPRKPRLLLLRLLLPGIPAGAKEARSPPLRRSPDPAYLPKDPQARTSRERLRSPRGAARLPSRPRSSPLPARRSSPGLARLSTKLPSYSPLARRNRLGSGTTGPSHPWSSGASRAGWWPSRRANRNPACPSSTSGRPWASFAGGRRQSRW